MKSDQAPRNTTKNNKKIILFFTFFIALLILLSSSLYLKYHFEHLKQQKIAQLKSIASLKKDQLELWLQERQKNTQLLFSASSLKDDLRLWNQNRDPALLLKIKKRLKNFSENMSFQSIEVINSKGQFVIENSQSKHQHLAETQSSLVSQAFAKNEIVFSNLYLDKRSAKENLHIDYFVPLLKEIGLGLIMRLDNTDFLFPFLQKWPLASDSAESLLFEVHKDTVVFLNQLRHAHNSALNLSIPLDKKDVLAVQVANDKVAMGEPIYGIDYRGKSVIGIAQSISGSSWFLIVKIDLEETYKEFYQEIILVIFSVLLALASLFSGMLFFLQRQKLHLATITQRDLAEHSLDTVFQALPDIYFRMSIDGTILDYRAKEKTHLYATPDKFLGRKMSELLPDEPGQQFKTILSKIKNNSDLSTIEYSLDLAQGKREFEARINSITNKQQVVCIVRDITEKKQIDRALSNAHELTQQQNIIFSAINRLFKQSIKSNTSNDIAQEYLCIAEEVTDNDYGIIIEVNQQQQFHTLAERDPKTSHPDLVQNEQIKELWKKALRTKETMIYNARSCHFDQDPPFSYLAEISDLMIIPFKHRSLQGIIMISRRKNNFRESDRKIIESIAFAFAEVINSKRDEEALINRELHLSTLLETLPDLIYLKDPNGIYLSCNKHFSQFYGVKKTDVVGKTDYDFVDKALADSFRNYDRQAIVSRKPSVNEERVRYNNVGDYLFLETTKTPMFNSAGKLIGVLGISHDITEHKKIEAKLLADEERYRELMENMSDGVSLYKPIENGQNFIFLEHNRAGEKITGVPRDQLIGQKITQAFPAVHAMGLLDVLKRVCQNARPEKLLSRKYQDEHSDIWLDNYVFKLTSGELVVVYQDISARKETELLLKEQLNELSRWQDITLGREGRILELKQEVNTLLIELKQPPRYSSMETT